MCPPSGWVSPCWVRPLINRPTPTPVPIVIYAKEGVWNYSGTNKCSARAALLTSVSIFNLSTQIEHLLCYFIILSPYLFYFYFIFLITYNYIFYNHNYIFYDSIILWLYY
jgi:hypothetical protein